MSTTKSGANVGEDTNSVKWGSPQRTGRGRLWILEWKRWILEWTWWKV